MHDCSAELRKYHNEHVTLTGEDRKEMRERRNTNRDRLKAGLTKKGLPQPLEFKSQGSYAMKTMVQHEDNDYDIDDGVYFDRSVLVGQRGAELSALQVRQLIRDAIDDGSFKSPPEVRTHCVRLVYTAGYHVDLPIYRRTIRPEMTDLYELASADWKQSDARDVTGWFEKEVKQKSPSDENGDYQLRRITRLLKKFARSRPSWQDQILSGFGITKLVTECYHADDRDDVSLHETAKAIHQRLKGNLEVKHPVTPGDTITNGRDDAKARFLRERLGQGLDWLGPLHARCSHEDALKCWDTFFSTEVFSEEGRKAKKDNGPITSGVLKEIGASASAQAAVQKQGGGRYA